MDGLCSSGMMASGAGGRQHMEQPPPLKWSTHRDSIIQSEEDQKMAGKRDKPEEIVAKLRQVEVLQGQGQSIADAVRQ